MHAAESIKYKNQRLERLPAPVFGYCREHISDKREVLHAVKLYIFIDINYIVDLFYVKSLLPVC